jgi:hypothetical protein
MKDKAGTMGAGMAFGFAIGGAVLTTVLGMLHLGIVGWVLNIALYVAAGWAAVFMTKASVGKGILAMLVGGIVSGIASFIIFKMAMSAVSSQVAGAMGEAAKNAGAAGNAQLNAQLAAAGSQAAGALGTMAAVMAFIGSMLWCFLVGMIGCFIGNSMKKSALGGGAAQQAKAA